MFALKQAVTTKAFVHLMQKNLLEQEHHLRITIKSLVRLDKKKLYLTHTNQYKPVSLLPFVKFVEVSDAVYFYTSIESKNVRWVSYHFDKNPEITQPVDNDLFKAFEFLKGNKSKDEMSNHSVQKRDYGGYNRDYLIGNIRYAYAFLIRHAPGFPAGLRHFRRLMIILQPLFFVLCRQI